MGELLTDRGSAGDLVVDMEAGLEHLSRGTTRHVDVLLAVAEPYYRSMETARRVYDLAGELGIPCVRLLPNKVRDAAEAEALASFAERHELALGGSIPYDEAVLDADRLGVGLLDHAGRQSAAAAAIDEVVEALVDGRI